MGGKQAMGQGEEIWDRIRHSGRLHGLDPLSGPQWVRENPGQGEGSRASKKPEPGSDLGRVIMAITAGFYLCEAGIYVGLGGGQVEMT